MDFNQTLNNDFQLYLDLCSNPEKIFPLTSREYVLSQCWLDRLIRYPCSNLQDRQVRNIYMAELVACLNERCLKGPFLRKPPAEPLERIDFNSVPDVTSDGEDVCELPYCPPPKVDCETASSRQNCDDDPNCIRSEGGQSSIHTLQKEQLNASSPQDKTTLNSQLSKEKREPTSVSDEPIICRCSNKCCLCKDTIKGDRYEGCKETNSDKFDKSSTIGPIDCAEDQPCCSVSTCKCMDNHVEDSKNTERFEKCFNSSTRDEANDSKANDTAKTSSEHSPTDTFSDKTFLESFEKYRTYNNIPNMSAPELEELHCNIRELLEAISSELRGLQKPGENEYLETELERYQKFLKSIADRSDSPERLHKTHSDTNQRSYLLLHLQTDLVSLLTDLGYMKYELKEEKTKGSKHKTNESLI